MNTARQAAHQQSISSTDLQQSSSSQDLSSSHEPISDLKAQPATKPITGSNPTGPNLENPQSESITIYTSWSTSKSTC
ncbi:hypothetical protein O181_065534 [Austropuccinia psidii MF-1]|uniref:Uncharacterized protein n=1 Tax=Austropuccinia psidii MF-1 TaxID=1389203 RepID=A0A9Q3I4M7_9BASI|nr:hypothetical protein [Austropuccinia psidii MF-1]